MEMTFDRSAAQYIMDIFKVFKCDFCGTFLSKDNLGGILPPNPNTPDQARGICTNIACLMKYVKEKENDN